MAQGGKIVLSTDKALAERYPGLSNIFYAERLAHLVDEGHLDSQGDLNHMRFSEVGITVPR